MWLWIVWAAKAHYSIRIHQDGILTETAKVKNPDAGYMYVFGFDRESNGTIVFTGQIETAYRVESPFLAWTSSDGQNQKVLLTDNYFPYELAVAPDDSIWTLGYEMVNLDTKDRAVNREANVLRHFDRDGTLIDSAFPQSQFDSYQLHRITTGLLIASRDRVGWYGPSGKNATYTEVTLGTLEKVDYPGAGRARSGAIAVALAFANGNLPAVFVSSPVRNELCPGSFSGHLDSLGSSADGRFQNHPAFDWGRWNQLVFKSGRESGLFGIQQ